MGSFNPTDSNWEIRAAVQVSLLLQVLLVFLGPVRKHSSHPLPRFTVWSCYLLADWVAVLSLGLLLNNISLSSFGLKHGGWSGATAGNDSGSSSHIISAFWTPFLLLHLGGPDTITAYSLEDNELWLRHLIVLLFELFAASIVFFCSVRGNPMIHATVLMFVAGIIKCAERTYSLYSGSVGGFRAKILDPPEPVPNYAKLMTEFDSKYKAGLAVEITIADGKAHKEMEEKETTRLVLDVHKSVEARAYEFFVIFRRLYVNHILGFKERRLSQAFFLERPDLTPTKAFEVIEVELSFIYDMVYTKAPVGHTRAGWALRCVCSSCLAAALTIFLLLDKRRHNISRVDTGITYVLLLGGLALDAAALCDSYEAAREMLLQVNTSEKPSAVKGGRSKSVLFDAVILAKALMDLDDEELMWEVVAGVWCEMLTYVAGKCRGSTHVRKLNHGGELITLVWLLMQHMGLSDMYEIQEGDPSVKLTVRE